MRQFNKENIPKEELDVGQFTKKLENKKLFS
jgi:hypothetical protein